MIHKKVNYNLEIINEKIKRKMERKRKQHKIENKQRSRTIKKEKKYCDNMPILWIGRKDLLLSKI